MPEKGAVRKVLCPIEKELPEQFRDIGTPGVILPAVPAGYLRKGSLYLKEKKPAQVIEQAGTGLILPPIPQGFTKTLGLENELTSFIVRQYDSWHVRKGSTELMVPIWPELDKFEDSTLPMKDKLRTAENITRYCINAEEEKAVEVVDQLSQRARREGAGNYERLLAAHSFDLIAKHRPPDDEANNRALNYLLEMAGSKGLDQNTLTVVFRALRYLGVDKDTVSARKVVDGLEQIIRTPDKNRGTMVTQKSFIKTSVQGRPVIIDFADAQRSHYIRPNMYATVALARIAEHREDEEGHRALRLLVDAMKLPSTGSTASRHVTGIGLTGNDEKSKEAIDGIASFAQRKWVKEGKRQDAVITLGIISSTRPGSSGLAATRALTTLLDNEQAAPDAVSQLGLTARFAESDVGSEAVVGMVSKLDDSVLGDAVREQLAKTLDSGDTPEGVKRVVEQALKE